MAGRDTEPRRTGREASDATAGDGGLPGSASARGKPVVGAAVEVTVAGTAGTRAAPARADTGAARTSIDAALAAEIGAGPVTDVTRVRTAGRAGGLARAVVDLVVGIDGDTHDLEASVEDRSQMRYPVLLGRDVLAEYHVDPGRRPNGGEA